MEATLRVREDNRRDLNLAMRIVSFFFFFFQIRKNCINHTCILRPDYIIIYDY